ncbi:putative lipoprotein YbbD precursor [bacterium BMS3Bbin06]|nr:putative lipoprotein YbbD precursor [bacterium BMS3Abin08]GBE33828.1 putative lipoprotein YbbD precursor [bacterium BMS3Bbin06]HDO35764.1 glycoside hydrolase family 3 protein [Nitrospirota bacterium]HDY70569.1 glycoside hydrolase family 3 protein [Nitrospirota bacterium]
MDNLERVLYRMIIARLDGDRIDDPSCRAELHDLVRKGIGGFIVFGGIYDEVSFFIEELQGASSSPLFIASDIERGVAQQIKGATEFPCQMAVAAAIRGDGITDMELLRGSLKSVAGEAADVGINMPLTPVLDVNRNPDNPIICTRAFSDNPDTVAWLGSEYIRAFESEGLLSCAKHFPGHGDTSVDSHMSLPVINKSYGELLEEDIAPFRVAVERGVSGIMAGHLSIPSIDAMPASLSERLIRGVLREELSFSGLVVTDALDMHALKGIRNIHTLSLSAGADLLLHPEDPEKAVSELLVSCRRGDLDEDTLKATLRRIGRFKEGLRLPKLVTEDLDTHRKSPRIIRERSITLVRDDRSLIPVRALNAVPVLVSGDKPGEKAGMLRPYFSDVRPLEGAGRRSAGTVIIAVFTDVKAWRGSSGIGTDERRKIERIIRNSESSVVISFGSPYLLRHFETADVLIAAYEPVESAVWSVVMGLGGEMEFRGALPVDIGLK